MSDVLDPIELALARLPSQYRGTPANESNDEKQLRALLTPAADFQATARAVLAGLSIDTAIGAQLTLLGKLVGRPRAGITDDDVYRRYVRAQIAANKSDGLNRDILTIARLVIDDPAADLTLRNEGVATYVLSVDGIALSTTVAAVLMALLRKATADGVRPILEYSTATPANTLHWGTSGTWGTSVWARATDKEI